MNFTLPPGVEVPELMKRCTKCGQVKPESEEHFRLERRANGRGYRARCRECDREWGRQNREKTREHNRRYREKHPTRTIAHKMVKNALKRGDLVPQPCEMCGDEPTEAHHDDYEMAMDVRWLCRHHHMEYHNLTHKKYVEMERKLAEANRVIREQDAMLRLTHGDHSHMPDLEDFDAWRDLLRRRVREEAGDE